MRIDLEQIAKRAADTLRRYRAGSFTVIEVAVANESELLYFWKVIRTLNHNEPLPRDHKIQVRID